jgi:hypothetical protein
MKPWQTVSNKAPNKGENGGQRERTQVQAKSAQTQRDGSKGAKEQIMFELQEAY